MSQPVLAESAERSTAPKRQLSLFDSTCIIVGIIIGAGIYRSSPTIASNVLSVSWLFFVWLLGGVLSFIGAVCYAELGTAYPRQGGDYVYLTRAFGRSPGFIFAWAQLWIVRPGSIGAMAFAFADFANRIWPRAEGEQAWVVLLAYAAGSVVFFTVINVLGVPMGKWTQNVLTTAKVLGLTAVFVVGIVLAVRLWLAPPTLEAPREVAPAAKAVETAAEVAPTAAGAKAAPEVPPTGMRALLEWLRWFGKEITGEKFALAMVFVLFAYGGWNEMAYVGAEVRNPTKNIWRAMALGTIAVTVIYLLVNLAFVLALGLEGTRKSTAPADVLQIGLGESVGNALSGLSDAILSWTGGRLDLKLDAGDILSLLVCISALGAVNGQVFTGARIYYAMGTEHWLYSWLGKWSGSLGTPIISLLIQGAITLGVVVAFGSTADGFENMVKFTTPAFWFFLTLVGLSAAELRWREPQTPRPFRIPLYPLPPIVLCLFSMFMVYKSLDYAIRFQSWEMIWSIGILGLGVVAAFLDVQPRRK